jgi:hypothetical protein
MPEPFFDTLQVSDQRAPTPLRHWRGSTSTTALQYHRVRNRHCCLAGDIVKLSGDVFVHAAVQLLPVAE